MKRWSKRRLKRYMYPSIALGFGLLWLVSAILLWSHWLGERDRIKSKFQHESQEQLEQKATEIETILKQIYYVGRTISLLPGVRANLPYNRDSDDQDIVSLGRMSASDYDTIQQFYNHIATLVDVSEIYVVYDGFDPNRGQVPFVMFDQIIVDRIQQRVAEITTADDGDIPEEEEFEEYHDYLRQLDYLRQNHYRMPTGSLGNIVAINSGMLRTCDNSQYLSKSSGDVRHSYGFTLSVPIYDLVTREFKGLVTTILRQNVLEAALIGWPVLPVTSADRKLLASLPGFDINSTPVNFHLEEQVSGISISDSRNHDSASIRANAAFHSEMKLELPGPANWVIHHYIPQSLLEAQLGDARSYILQQIGILSLVLLMLWYAVYSLLDSQRKTAAQLREYADVDALTGLPNRRMIGLYMNAILKATPKNHYFATVMIDIDDFKQVNDSLGHEAGDRLLVEIASRFNRVLRNDDYVLRITNDDIDETVSVAERVMGRLGGDEFLVILGNLTSRELCSDVAGRLLASLANPIEIGPERIYARVSMGIAIYPDDGDNPATLLRSADIALYEAKSRGRGQTVIYAPELNADSMRQLQMMAALHEALAEQQFFLLYQPELHVESSCINAAEALLRWQHPEFGLVMPFEFIPLLERSGLIVEVGEWILRTACEQFLAWQTQGLDLSKISVNISPKQLAQADFTTMVANTLEQARFDPKNLVLEVTETIFMDNPTLAIKSLAEVRKLGVNIAIDDFGTGYSSLSYLRTIPLDILKIDRSFVIECESESGLAICDMLVALSARLGLKVVAEGVETQSQLDKLQGADWIQGYYIARPITAEEFLQKVSDFPSAGEAPIESASRKLQLPAIDPIPAGSSD